MATLSVRIFDPVRGLVTGGAELLSSPGLRWVDVTTPDEPTMAHLQEKFDLHRLAVEDCLHLDQRPKLEDYPTHEFIVVQGFCGVKSDPARVHMHEMHLCLGPNWLITVHAEPHPAVGKIIDRLTRDPQDSIGRGADFLAYLIVDAMVDENFPVLDGFNDELEALETAVFEKPSPAHLKRMFALKRALVEVRRVLSPQRDVMALLSKPGVPHVSDRTSLYFRDVYDHLVRLYEQIDAARDLLGNAMEGYLSVQANRTADVSKQLTIIATVFLPLSFVVGFFGQNFPALAQDGFFYAMLGCMVALPSAMLWWFRRKQWL